MGFETLRVRRDLFGLPLAAVSAGRRADYEAEMADPHGRATVSLMRAGRILKDNRLLPLGFQPERGLPPGLDAHSLAPVGVEGDADFGAGADTVRYEVAVDPAAGPWPVAVEALYQSVKPTHAAVFDATRSSEEAEFLVAFTARRRAPAAVERAEVRVR